MSGGALGLNRSVYVLLLGLLSIAILALSLTFDILAAPFDLVAIAVILVAVVGAFAVIGVLDSRAPSA